LSFDQAILFVLLIQEHSFQSKLTSLRVSSGFLRFMNEDFFFTAEPDDEEQPTGEVKPPPPPPPPIPPPEVADVVL